MIQIIDILIIKMDPREKLKNIQEQKRTLQQKLNTIDNTSATLTTQQDLQLEKLLQRKKIIQDKRKQEEKYMVLQKQYIDRKKQVERERELQRIKNEKRIIELEVAMKKQVFEGMKEKIKGMNSEQLMLRGFAVNDDSMHNNSVNGLSKGLHKEESTFKDAFEGYLMKEGGEKITYKYNLNDLNEKRMQIYERKEEVVMKQILLKQLAASDEPIQMDVLNMGRQQLIEQLQRRGIWLDQFMHPVKKEVILDNFDSIKNDAHKRIQYNKQNLMLQKKKLEEEQRYKKTLREEVRVLPYKSVEVVKRLLFDLFDQICESYDKRHVKRSKEDQKQLQKKLLQEYEQVCNINLVQQVSNEIIEDMIEKMKEQMVRQSAQEMLKLNEFAHEKASDCFKAVFEGNVLKRLNDLGEYKIPLVWSNEDESMINREANNKYLNKEMNKENIFETEENTINLINDISLLDQEEAYINAIQIKFQNEKEYPHEDYVFFYDQELYAVNKQHINIFSKAYTLYSFQPHLKHIELIHKVHKNWLISSESSVVLVTPWAREEYGNIIGSRISNPCGNITYCELYPIVSLLSSPCSMLVGFQKGQILKFNYNNNRITNRQTNISHYLPVVQNVKTGDEPAFPLDNRNYIQIQQEKPKGNDSIHQFRQFFEHHSEPIVFLGFFNIDKFISVDKCLKCAIWQYKKSKGVSSYEPFYKFQIKSTYLIYKQDQNPRYKDIYPLSNSPQTPQEIYIKYMQTQSFLKLQLYNNPKKEIAYFKAPGWELQEQEKSIWKITYKENKKQAHKILQSYYNAIDGKITAEVCKLQNQTLYLLCQREHVLRNDLKTMKLYSWSLQERKLGRIGLEIDLYKDQKITNFVIMKNMLRGVQMQTALIINSGRILLFSLVSGQILRNINDLAVPNTTDQRYYFKSLQQANDRNLIYAATAKTVVEITWQDPNSISQRNKLNKIIDNTRKRYFR